MRLRLAILGLLLASGCPPRPSPTAPTPAPAPRRLGQFRTLTYQARPALGFCPPQGLVEATVTRAGDRLELSYRRQDQDPVVRTLDGAEGRALQELLDSIGVVRVADCPAPASASEPRKTTTPLDGGGTRTTYDFESDTIEAADPCRFDVFLLDGEEIFDRCGAVPHLRPADVDRVLERLQILAAP